MAPDGFPGNAVGAAPPRSTASGDSCTSPPGTTTTRRLRRSPASPRKGDPVAQRACLPADDYFDSVMALDLKTGAIRWVDASDELRRLDGRLHPLHRRGHQLPRAGRTRLRLRPGAGAVHRPGRQQATVTSSGPARRAASTGRSTPTPAQSSGSPRLGPAARPAACSGARPSTAAASTPPTPTATAVPWTLPNGTTTTNGVWSGIDAVTGAAAVADGTASCARWRLLRPGDHGKRRGLRLRTRPAGAHVRPQRGHRSRSCGPSPVAARACRAPPSPRAGCSGGRATPSLRHTEQQALLLRLARLRPRPPPAGWAEHAPRGGWSKDRPPRRLDASALDGRSGPSRTRAAGRCVRRCPG